MKTSRETNRNSNNLKLKTPFPTLFEIEPDPLDVSSNKLSKLSKRASNFNLARKSFASSLSAPQHIEKFAKLKYGQDKQVIFNLDCQMQILVGYFETKFKKELNPGEKKRAKFDLIDEQGQLKYIQDETIKSKSALLFLEPRKTYILAKIEQNELNEEIPVPLVKTPDPAKADSPSIRARKKNSLAREK